MCWCSNLIRFWKVTQFAGHFDSLRLDKCKGHYLSVAEGGVRIKRPGHKFYLLQLSSRGSHLIPVNFRFLLCKLWVIHKLLQEEEYFPSPSQPLSFVKLFLMTLTSTSESESFLPMCYHTCFVSKLKVLSFISTECLCVHSLQQAESFLRAGILFSLGHTKHSGRIWWHLRSCEQQICYHPHS